MDEAAIDVQFQTPDGDYTWRRFHIQVGPDDTKFSIANRLGELVEDYLAGEVPPSDQIQDLTPVIGPGELLEFNVISWPSF